RLRRQDREALDLLAVPLPLFPQPREREWPCVTHREQVRLTILRRAGPLVKPGRGDQAAAALESGAEGRVLRDRLRPGVEVARADADVIGPGRDQAPLE